MMLTKLLDEYVALRRSTGFKFRTTEGILRAFVNYAEARGDCRVRAKTAVRWASEAKRPRCRYNRLRAVARFAEHLRAEDHRHELLPARLFVSSPSRPTPRIFTEDEIARIVASAREVGRKNDLLGRTYSTLFGLIATTGLRLSEAISLRVSDVSDDGLMIRKTKFGKSRFVPLHSTTMAVLKAYMCERRRFAKDTNVVFLSHRHGQFSKHAVLMKFRQVCEMAASRGTPSASARAFMTFDTPSRCACSNGPRLVVIASSATSSP